MVVAAFVLGLVSTAGCLIIGWVPFLGQIELLICGVLAIIFSVRGRKNEPDKKDMAIAALVLGIVGSIWAIGGLIVWSVAINMMSKYGKDLFGEFFKATK